MRPTEGWLAALGAAITARRMYPAEHPQVVEAMERFEGEIRRAEGPGGVTLFEIEGTLAVNGAPVEGPVPSVLVRALAAAGVDLVRLGQGVTRDELQRLVDYLAAFGEAEPPRWEHVAVGKAHLGGTAEVGPGSVAAAPEAVARDRVAVVAEALAPARRGEAPQGRVLIEVAQALDEAAARASALTELYAPADRAQWHEVHAHNVAALVALVARAAGLARGARIDLTVAAMVHDLGMLGIEPERVVAALERGEEELTVASDHPVKGLARAVVDPVLPPVAAVVAWEHHWPVGGNSGRDPHPAARVVAAAERVELELWRGGGEVPPAPRQGLDARIVTVLEAMGAAFR